MTICDITVALLYYYTAGSQTCGVAYEKKQQNARIQFNAKGIRCIIPKALEPMSSQNKDQYLVTTTIHLAHSWYVSNISKALIMPLMKKL